ncbi:MAG: purine-nucleoside phosphorylase [Myxococcota bacterium]|nr:purine-nucleoside phosphorylase [Myxococcota bacterium]
MALIERSLEAIRGRYQGNPKVGLILGSGLGFVADEIEGEFIDYSALPGFPKSTIVGHRGRLALGTLEGTECVCMQGRVHYYEGHSMATLAFPVRLMARLGVKHLLVTNAAGGINQSFEVGDLMVISDHLNLMGGSPLRGPNLEAFGDRFPDMSEAYTVSHRARGRRCAEGLGLQLREGVYAAMMGPAYETPAEIRMASRLGADAVGMSTVPEVLAAAHAGLQVAGLSVITNKAAGFSENPLNHDEVFEASQRARSAVVPLLRSMIRALSEV